jgi:hypothetical protein
MLFFSEIEINLSSFHVLHAHSSHLDVCNAFPLSDAENGRLHDNVGLPAFFFL